MFYLAQMVNYPESFERLVYCSQLVQAECIRSNVEHMRRARGRCMGSAYWQVNDSNPVISWSSIDYFGRWKALHYAARRFYAPVLLSCDDTDPLHPVLYVTNDTPKALSLTAVCRLRGRDAAVLQEETVRIGNGDGVRQAVLRHQVLIPLQIAAVSRLVQKDEAVRMLAKLVHKAANFGVTRLEVLESQRFGRHATDAEHPAK